MHIIHRISIASAFKVGLGIYALLSIVLGFLFIFLPSLFGASMLNAMMGADGGAGGFGAGLVGGLVFWVVIVVAYSLLGGIFIAISAWAYNFVATRWGGLAIELREGSAAAVEPPAS